MIKRKSGLEKEENKIKGISFELNEKLDIVDLIPVQQEFSVNDVIYLESTAYRLNQKLFCCPILIQDDNLDTKTLWIDANNDYEQVRNYLLTINPEGNAHCSKNIRTVKNIESLSKFLNTEYGTERQYMYQNIENDRKKVYWDDCLEILDLRNFKHQIKKFA